MSTIFEIYPRRRDGSLGGPDIFNKADSISSGSIVYLFGGGSVIKSASIGTYSSSPQTDWHREETYHPTPQTFTPNRHLLEKGTVVYVYNKSTGMKHRQELNTDFYFTNDNIISGDNDEIVRIDMSRGDWEWMEVDYTDICDIHYTTRKQKRVVEPTEGVVQKEMSKEEIEELLVNEMAKEIAKEIDAQIVKTVDPLISNVKVNSIVSKFKAEKGIKSP